MTATKNGADSARADAQEMLADIARIKGQIGGMEAQYAEKIRQIKGEYAAKMAPWEELLEAREAALREFMRLRKADLFAGADIVYLAAGQLLFSVLRKIAYPRKRDALIALLEKLGFIDAVKVAKSVDTDEIDKWPDEKLALAGLQRKPPEDTFDYSLAKEEPCKKA